MPKQIILVRHGETDHNKSKKLMNWANDIGSLTEKGREEANIVGKRLKKHKIDAVYVSDLKRTRETAEEIAKHVPVKQVLASGIRERNLGLFGDLNFDEIKAKWPDKFEKFIDHSDKDWNGLEGESISDVCNRFETFLNGLHSEHKDQTVLLVTHSGIMYTVLRDHFGFLPQDSWLDVAHTSLTIIEKVDGKYILKSFNDVET
jgi:broad specificity phosphatase PhoE